MSDPLDSLSNMSSVSDRDDLLAAFDTLQSAVDGIGALTFDSLTNPERLVLLRHLERLSRQLLTPRNALLQQLTEQAAPKELGAKSLPEALSRALSISRSEARRRAGEAADLAPRTSLTGDRLAPRLEPTATALGRGDIGPEHVRVIRTFLAGLPTAVDAATREAAERQLAELAAGLDPEGLRKCADRLTALLHPDGDFDDAERARRRFFLLGRQGPDGLSPIKGMLDPEARAYLEAVLAAWAAPGVCNPDDEKPTVDDEPTEQTKQRDTRSPLQRNHDALKATLRAILASGKLGVHRGLPVTVVVSATVQDLHAAAGKGVTGGGSLLPMRDLIRMASHAWHYLCVFDKHSSRPLYLGRTKRIATADQRIVLHALIRGCSFPNCDAPGYYCQAHHITDWADDGNTDVDELTFGCPPHHDLATTYGWTTRKDRRGRTEWLPPPHLRARGAPGAVNNYHHPDRLLLGQDHDADDADAWQPRDCDAPPEAPPGAEDTRGHDEVA